MGGLIQNNLFRADGKPTCDCGNRRLTDSPILLSSLTNLSTLELFDNILTQSQIDKLKENLPDCIIEY